MRNISGGSNTDEQDLSKKATVICQDVKASSSVKSVQKVSGAAKRSKSSKKGKRPLSSSNTPKHPRLLRDEGSAKKRQSSKKGKRPLSSSNIPAPKYPRPLEDEGCFISVVVKFLKAEYKRRSHLRPLFWDSTFELPLDDVYTRLKIVSRRKADFRVEDNEVNVFDIFTALDKGEDVMTLVEGSPGIGKTTFCLKLAYDWAHGKIPAECSFPKFELMLLLKCRDIHKDIMETISEQLLPEDTEEKTKERLFDFIKDIHNQEKTLIVLDGLDELPQGSEQFVDKLLQRRILSFCYVLATSRQERGIDVRRKYCFDILLEIKGFTESGAFEYIRKHFKNVDPLHSPKGESLIKEIQENTLLHALRNNPLNLLLLCVVYEDYEGNLPSSRSELYQVIVLCLLRRHCAKHNLEAPQDNNALEKQFEESILALGELAWMCLLSDRYCFRESEIAALERRYKGLLSRHIGLVYKEESLRKIKPQHEYYFLHKTFQEYLAAAFIAHKLRGNELMLFERLRFHELVKKYREVFLFVSGILGRDANILFTQIGEELKNWGEWDWVTCKQSGLVTIDDRERNWIEYFNIYREDNDEDHDDKDQGWTAATFLAKSFSESGHAEKMAETLCSYIPFPTHVEIDLSHNAQNIYHVLEACKTFANVQKPVQLTVFESSAGVLSHENVAESIQSCSQLQTLSIFIPAMEPDLAKALHNGLSRNTTLSEFILQVSDSIHYDAAVAIGESLAARKALSKVTFQLDRVWGKNWTSAIEPALSADTPLKSVDLQVRGSLSDTAVYGLGKLLSNKALASFSLNISGDVLEFVAAVISRGIAQQTALKALAFIVDGNLSLSSVTALQNSLLENRSLSDLALTLRGEIPDNWQSVVEKLRSVKKGSLNCTFYPDPGSSVKCNQVAHFCPAVVEKGLETKQHFTVNLWGELKCSGAEDLCEILVRVPLTSLTLKVHGNLSDGVASIIKRYLGRQNTLSSLTIDIWGELAPGTGTLLQELSDKNVTVQVKEHGVSVAPKEACNALDVCIDNAASLTPMFSEVKNTRKERITLKIINDDKVISDWPRLLGDALAESTSLTTLDLTVSNYTMNPGIWKYLGDSLLRSSSLTLLSLTISNYSNMTEGWECTLVNSLAKMASLTALSLSIDDRGGGVKFGEDLMVVKSLSTLSVVINGSQLTDFWGKFLRKCLDECNSLTKLCLTSNDYTDSPYDATLLIDSIEKRVSWQEGLAFGLAYTSSLKELVITINHITRTYVDLEAIFIGPLSVNNSIASLTVTVSDYQLSSCALWVGSLKSFIAENKSLTTLTLTLNDYSDGVQHDWLYPDRRDGHFPENTSLTELNLTVNIRSEVSEDWLPSLCDYLMLNCSSLKTVRLQVNNHCATGKSRIYDLSKLRLKYRSLSTFELAVTFYGE
ncbi:hypothetical protein ABFA07_021169 [Porites harrisoni]